MNLFSFRGTTQHFKKVPNCEADSTNLSLSSRRSFVFPAIQLMCVLALAATSISCGGTFAKKTVKSSNDETVAGLINEADGKASEKQYSYQTKSSKRMDHVEFLIQQDLSKKKSKRASRRTRSLPEAESSFASNTKTWRPSRQYSVPFTKNQNVDRWVRYFTGSLRSNFQRWIKRASWYAPFIEEVAEEYRLPKDLVFLAMIESGFNLNAYSHAHAAGPWQFIKSTGRMYGLKYDGIIDERRDLVKATHAALRHLRDLHNRYNNWYLAFAAYNAGAGKVDRAIKRGHTRNFWNLASRHSRLFRQETKDYVPKILAASYITKNYRKFGFSNSLFEQPVAFERVTVSDATDVYAIASSVGVKQSEIEFLNPDLLVGVTPANKSYQVKVPLGKAELFNANFRRIPQKKRNQFVIHKVHGKRETLHRIARKYRVSVTKLAKANGMTPKTRLAPGMYMRIPTPLKYSLAKYFKPLNDKQSAFAQADTQREMIAAIDAVEDSSDKNTSIDAVIEDSGSEQAEEAEVQSQESSVAQTYRINSGDTLIKIAKKHHVWVSSLRKWNNLNKGDVIKAGEVLLVSKGTAPANYERYASATPKPVKQQTYKVVSGDSLIKIAKQFSVDVSDIQKWNKMGEKNSIRIGQVLKVSNGTQSSSAVYAAAPKNRSDTAYVVQSGDTLSDIALASKVSVNQIRSLNGLSENDVIRAGQKLKVSGSPSIAKKSKGSFGLYQVQPGDTLGEIAALHHMSLASIRDLNDFDSNMIKVGQKVKVSGSVKQSASSRVVPISPSKERLIIHAVRNGETLWDLSRKYGVSVNELKKWNKLKGESIQPKQKIKIYVLGNHRNDQRVATNS